MIGLVKHRPAAMDCMRKTTIMSRDDTRAKLIRTGTEIFSEKGFGASGLEELLTKAGVPKGSFYHYFGSKQEFGLAVIDNYAFIWEQKLTRLLRNPNVGPLQRVDNYIAEAIRGLEKYGFARGCLIGSVSQEIVTLNEAFRARALKVFAEWSDYLVSCLDEAKDLGQIDQFADTQMLADFFWMAWEGAILKARLEQSVMPIKVFQKTFSKYIFNAFPP